MKKQTTNMGIRKAKIAINDYLSIFGESATVENFGKGDTIVVKMIVMGSIVSSELFGIAKTFGLSSYVSVSMDGRSVQFNAYVG